MICGEHKSHLVTIFRECFNRTCLQNKKGSDEFPFGFRLTSFSGIIEIDNSIWPVLDDTLIVLRSRQSMLQTGKGPVPSVLPSCPFRQGNCSLHRWMTISADDMSCRTPWVGYQDVAETKSRTKQDYVSVVICNAPSFSWSSGLDTEFCISKQPIYFYQPGKS